MAGVSTPELAAAVSNAGSLGSIGIGASSVDEARQMIAKTRSLTNRAFNVNLFCHEPALRDTTKEAAWLQFLAPLFQEMETSAPTKIDEIYKTFLTDEDAFRMLLDHPPAVVSFHFGIPTADRIAAFRAAGVKTLATATSLREAALIEAAGIDGIVAQGVEAGGHRGVFDPDAVDERLSTAVLVRLLARQTKLPIIAAGGIMDGQGISAMLELGAAGAQLGTAFVLCPESAANPAYRRSLKGERAYTTRLTSVLSGRPARGMVNRFILHGESLGSPLPASYPVAYDAAKRLGAAAGKKDIHEFAAQWAGQGAPLAREMPAAELISTLLDELSSISIRS